MELVRPLGRAQHPAIACRRDEIVHHGSLICAPGWKDCECGSRFVLREGDHGDIQWVSETRAAHQACTARGVDGV